MEQRIKDKRCCLKSTEYVVDRAPNLQESIDNSCSSWAGWAGLEWLGSVTWPLSLWNLWMDHAFPSHMSPIPPIKEHESSLSPRQIIEIHACKRR